MIMIMTFCCYRVSVYSARPKNF